MDNELRERLDTLEALMLKLSRNQNRDHHLLLALLEEGEQTMADLSKLQTSVEKETTVNQGAITLLNQLAQMLRDAAANTPAAPTP